MALYKGSTKVSWTWVGFEPSNVWTTWQLLTKTSAWYNWADAPETGIWSSNDTYENVVYLSQAEYDALTTKDPNTLYSTPDGEAGSFVDDTAFWSSWDWVTDKAPSQNAVYDKVASMVTDINNKASIVYITQDDYDELPSSKLTDWVNYVIIEEDA